MVVMELGHDPVENEIYAQGKVGSTFDRTLAEVGDIMWH
jgi:hypothetical protein